jgi:hypothetical protein
MTARVRSQTSGTAQLGSMLRLVTCRTPLQVCSWGDSGQAFFELLQRHSNRFRYHRNAIAVCRPVTLRGYFGGAHLLPQIYPNMTFAT